MEASSFVIPGKKVQVGECLEGTLLALSQTSENVQTVPPPVIVQKGRREVFKTLRPLK